MYDLNNWAARGSCGVREWPRVCRRGTWEECMSRMSMWYTGAQFSVIGFG